MGSFSKCRGGGQAQTRRASDVSATGLASVEGAVKPRLLMLSATTGCI